MASSQQSTVNNSASASQTNFFRQKQVLKEEEKSLMQMLDKFNDQLNRLKVCVLSGYQCPNIYFNNFVERRLDSRSRLRGQTNQYLWLWSWSMSLSGWYENLIP